MSVRGYIDIWYPYWQRGIKTKKVLSMLHRSTEGKNRQNLNRARYWPGNSAIECRLGGILTFDTHIGNGEWKRKKFCQRCTEAGTWRLIMKNSSLSNQFGQKTKKWCFPLIYIKIIFFGGFVLFLGVFGPFLMHFELFLAIFHWFLAIFGQHSPPNCHLPSFI